MCTCPCVLKGLYYLSLVTILIQDFVSTKFFVFQSGGRQNGSRLEQTEEKVNFLHQLRLGYRVLKKCARWRHESLTWPQ